MYVMFIVDVSIIIWYNFVLYIVLMSHMTLLFLLNCLPEYDVLRTYLVYYRFIINKAALIIIINSAELIYFA